MACSGQWWLDGEKEATDMPQEQAECLDEKRSYQSKKKKTAKTWLCCVNIKSDFTPGDKNKTEKYIFNITLVWSEAF